MRLCLIAWGVAAIAVSLVVASPALALGAKDRARAASLYDHAVALLERQNIEGRRGAIAALEQATLLDPGNPSYELTLARVYYEAGFLKSSRQRFERVVAMRPEDAEGRYGLGQVWRRDWLKYLDRGSLARAIEQLSACCRLRPSHVDGWILLVPLLVEQGDLRAAYNAARRAVEADRSRAEPQLAVAYTAYRNGYVDVAARTFAAAIPRLTRSVRERFDDIAPVATERDTMAMRALSEPEKAAYVRRFWKDLDPDVTTPENEALLEYQARVAHAYFLYYNPKRREWDERGEVYVRYGAPARTIYNPVGINLNFSRRQDGVWTSGAPFPTNVLVWDYPELGMTVTMHDRSLTEYYLLPVTMDRSADPVPDADSLARRGDRFPTYGGRGVFPVLPPGVEPLPVEGHIARFETDREGQVLAQMEAPGTPGDSIWVEWAVLDSAQREVVRGRRNSSPSACDPSSRRVADFAAGLPPGEYVVGMTARDRRGRRGVHREILRVGPAAASLALSDLVVSCGAPFVGPSGTGVAVRPEPNPGARVAPGDPVTAYFEIYHLSPDRDGLARFEYLYTVRSAERDPRIWIQRAFAPRRLPDPISASRTEEQVGAIRRQFVSVPVQAMPPGKYRLEVRVRDLVAGSEALAQAEFLKLGAGGVTP